MRFREHLLLSEQRKKTDSTTFFHENAVAIFLKDMKASITSGKSVMNYYYDNKIVALSPSLSKINPEVIEKDYARFLEKAPGSEVISDAQKVAKAIISKIGKPRGIVYWTGPTNDATKYGAADIMFKMGSNEIPISLKKGKGQLKNLGLKNIGDILLKGIIKPGEDLVNKVVEPEYIKYWDNMTRDWLKIIHDVSDNPQIKEIVGRNLNLNWDGYQAQKLNDMEIEVVKEYVKKDKLTTDEKTLRYLARKIYEFNFGSKGSPSWGKAKREAFNEIFGRYFDNKEELINKNLKEFFKAQISVSDNELWYAAEGGKKILYIPSKERFESISNKLLDFSFKSQSTPTGYTITIYATRKGSKKSLAIMTIDVDIRWSQGQMNGKPGSNSKMKLHVDPEEWNQVFSEKAMFIK